MYVVYQEFLQDFYKIKTDYSIPISHGGTKSASLRSISLYGTAVDNVFKFSSNPKGIKKLLSDPPSEGGPRVNERSRKKFTIETDILLSSLFGAIGDSGAIVKNYYRRVLKSSSGAFMRQRDLDFFNFYKRSTEKNMLTFTARRTRSVQMRKIEQQLENEEVLSKETKEALQQELLKLKNTTMMTSSEAFEEARSIYSSEKGDAMLDETLLASQDILDYIKSDLFDHYHSETTQPEVGGTLFRNDFSYSGVLNTDFDDVKWFLENYSSAMDDPLNRLKLSQINDDIQKFSMMMKIHYCEELFDMGSQWDLLKNLGMSRRNILLNQFSENRSMDFKFSRLLASEISSETVQKINRLSFERITVVPKLEERHDHGLRISELYSELIQIILRHQKKLTLSTRGGIKRDSVSSFNVPRSFFKRLLNKTSVQDRVNMVLNTGSGFLNNMLCYIFSLPYERRPNELSKICYDEDRQATVYCWYHEGKSIPCVIFDDNTGYTTNDGLRFFTRRFNDSILIINNEYTDDLQVQYRSEFANTWRRYLDCDLKFERPQRPVFCFKYNDENLELQVIEIHFELSRSFLGRSGNLALRTALPYLEIKNTAMYVHDIRLFKMQSEVRKNRKVVMADLKGILQNIINMEKRKYVTETVSSSSFSEEYSQEPKMMPLKAIAECFNKLGLTVFYCEHVGSTKSCFERLKLSGDARIICSKNGMNNNLLLACKAYYKNNIASDSNWSEMLNSRIDSLKLWWGPLGGSPVGFTWEQIDKLQALISLVCRSNEIPELDVCAMLSRSHYKIPLIIQRLLMQELPEGSVWYHPLIKRLFISTAIVGHEDIITLKDKFGALESSNDELETGPWKIFLSPGNYLVVDAVPNLIKPAWTSIPLVLNDLFKEFLNLFPDGPVTEYTLIPNLLSEFVQAYHSGDSELSDRLYRVLIENKDFLKSVKREILYTQPSFAQNEEFLSSSARHLLSYIMDAGADGDLNFEVLSEDQWGELIKEMFFMVFMSSGYWTDNVEERMWSVHKMLEENNKAILWDEEHSIIAWTLTSFQENTTDHLDFNVVRSIQAQAETKRVMEIRTVVTAEELRGAVEELHQLKRSEAVLKLKMKQDNAALVRRKLVFVRNSHMDKHGNLDDFDEVQEAAWILEEITGEFYSVEVDHELDGIKEQRLAWEGNDYTEPFEVNNENKMSSVKGVFSSPSYKDFIFTVDDAMKIPTFEIPQKRDEGFSMKSWVLKGNKKSALSTINLIFKLGLDMDSIDDNFQQLKKLHKSATTSSKKKGAYSVSGFKSSNFAFSGINDDFLGNTYVPKIIDQDALRRVLHVSIKCYLTDIKARCILKTLEIAHSLGYVDTDLFRSCAVEAVDSLDNSFSINLSMLLISRYWSHTNDRTVDDAIEQTSYLTETYGFMTENDFPLSELVYHDSDEEKDDLQKEDEELASAHRMSDNERSADSDGESVITIKAPKSVSSEATEIPRNNKMKKHEGNPEKEKIGKHEETLKKASHIDPARFVREHNLRNNKDVSKFCAFYFGDLHEIFDQIRNHNLSKVNQVLFDDIFEVGIRREIRWPCVFYCDVNRIFSDLSLTSLEEDESENPKGDFSERQQSTYDSENSSDGYESEVILVPVKQTNVFGHIHRHIHGSRLSTPQIPSDMQETGQQHFMELTEKLRKLKQDPQTEITEDDEIEKKRSASSSESRTSEECSVVPLTDLSEKKSDAKSESSEQCSVAPLSDLEEDKSDPIKDEHSVDNELITTRSSTDCSVALLSDLEEEEESSSAEDRYSVSTMDSEGNLIHAGQKRHEVGKEKLKEEERDDGSVESVDSDGFPIEKPSKKVSRQHQGILIWQGMGQYDVKLENSRQVGKWHYDFEITNWTNPDKLNLSHLKYGYEILRVRLRVSDSDIKYCALHPSELTKMNPLSTRNASAEKTQNLWDRIGHSFNNYLQSHKTLEQQKIYGMYFEKLNERFTETERKEVINLRGKRYADLSSLEFKPSGLVLGNKNETDVKQMFEKIQVETNPAFLKYSRDKQLRHIEDITKTLEGKSSILGCICHLSIDKNTILHQNEKFVITRRNQKRANLFFIEHYPFLENVPVKLIKDAANYILDKMGSNVVTCGHNINNASTFHAHIHIHLDGVRLSNCVSDITTYKLFDETNRIGPEHYAKTGLESSLHQTDNNKAVMMFSSYLFEKGFWLTSMTILGSVTPYAISNHLKPKLEISFNNIRYFNEEFKHVNFADIRELSESKKLLWKSFINGLNVTASDLFDDPQFEIHKIQKTILKDPKERLLIIEKAGQDIEEVLYDLSARKTGDGHNIDDNIFIMNFLNAIDRNLMTDVPGDGLCGLHALLGLHDCYEGGYQRLDRDQMVLKELQFWSQSKDWFENTAIVRCSQSEIMQTIYTKYFNVVIVDDRGHVVTGKSLDWNYVIVQSGDYMDHYKFIPIRISGELIQDFDEEVKYVNMKASLYIKRKFKHASIRSSVLTEPLVEAKTEKSESIPGAFPLAIKRPFKKLSDIPNEIKSRNPQAAGETEQDYLNSINELMQ
jgi:hypothetical protein